MCNHIACASQVTQNSWSDFVVRISWSIFVVQENFFTRKTRVNGVGAEGEGGENVVPALSPSVLLVPLYIVLISNPMEQ